MSLPVDEDSNMIDLDVDGSPQVTASPGVSAGQPVRGHTAYVCAGELFSKVHFGQSHRPTCLLE